MSENKISQAKIVEKNSDSSNTLRQHLHLRMIIMYLIKKPRAHRVLSDSLKEVEKSLGRWCTEFT